MKVSAILAFVAAVAIAAPVADPTVEADLDIVEFEAREVDVPEVELEKRANVPTLGKTQSTNARAIFGEIKKTKVGHHGCLAVFATALVESEVYIYANKAVPKSLHYHHDKVGSDYDSIGIFQQRARYYPNIKTDMSAAGSAGQFISKMKGVHGWKTMSVGKLCQKVQVSAYPDRYSKKVAQAEKICKAGGF